MNPSHPMQPLTRDSENTIRFKQNSIVRFLLDSSRYDLNDLSSMQFSHEDWCQFAQLIGYSLYGFGDLSYVTEKDWQRATTKARLAKIKEEKDIKT